MSTPSISLAAALKAAFLRLLAGIGQPKDQTMGANGFKTPSRFMAGLITVVLLALYAVSYLAPALSVSWIKSDAKFDAALQQTLLLMLTLSIGYYIGSSKGSADANDAMRAQVVANIPPAPTPTASPAPPAMVAPAGELGPFATLAALQAAVPAAVANAGKRAWVGSAIPFASYVSDGTTWNPDVAAAAPAAAAAPVAPVPVVVANAEPIDVALTDPAPASAAPNPKATTAPAAAPRNPF